MIDNFTSILIGFSILSSLLLLLTYLSAYKTLDKTLHSVAACVGLLLGLASLQYIHLQYLKGDTEVLNSHIYTGFLLLTPPCFYIFGRHVLEFNYRTDPLLLVHFVPLVLSPLLQPKLLIPIAFVFGTAYSLRVSFLLYALKSQRKNFTLEFSAFACFALIAVFILVLGLMSSYLGEHLYVVVYANLIGLAFFAMVYILLRFPDVTQKTIDAVIAIYAASTLKNADCNALAAKVKQLFEEQKLHRNENLSLADVAAELALTAHQTSELINTQFDMGFSRLVRQYRIDDAKRQLIDEPKASVLSIGLSVGFNSQSNFYAAFREIAGQTPAQYRKSQGTSDEIPTQS